MSNNSSSLLAAGWNHNAAASGEYLSFAGLRIQIIRRSRMRSVRLKVLADGKVVVSCPTQLSASKLQQFCAQSLNWIERQQQINLERSQNVPMVAQDQLWLHGQHWQLFTKPAPAQTVENTAQPSLKVSELPTTEVARQQLYFDYANTWLPAQLSRLSLAQGLPFRRLSIRAQKTLWGSCSAKHDISLNWRLVQIPQWVAEYVLLHELVHTLQPNHSQAFWAECEQRYRRTSEARLWLKGVALADLPDQFAACASD